VHPTTSHPTTTQPPGTGRRARHFRTLWLLVATALLGTADGAATDPTDDAAPLLAPGATVERQLAGGTAPEDHLRLDAARAETAAARLYPRGTVAAWREAIGHHRRAFGRWQSLGEDAAATLTISLGDPQNAGVWGAEDTGGGGPGVAGGS